MTETQFPTLFSPFQLGSLTLRNRVVLAPHSTHYANRVESERLSAYLAERAKGGVGLIIHEPVIVHPSSLSRVGKIWGYDPDNGGEYRRTTDLVHEHGAGILCQLIHNGRQVDGFESGLPAWYPSVASRPGTSELTHEMTHGEIAEVVAGFARSARICREGGFDGVEIHAAHGYLLQAFLSPATNRRDDEYGGDVTNRTRIVRDVVAAIRAEVGSDFVVGIRVVGDEFQPGGLDTDGAGQVAEALAGAGGVDYFSVVSGALSSHDRIVPDMSFPRALNAPLAAPLRERVRPVPVLVTGRIAEPREAEEILAAGQADLVGIVRSAIADPRWVAKAQAGTTAQIRPCVYGNDCRDAIGARRALSCMVNPDAGTESRPARPVTVGSPRRVVVVGGGIAGMEAAVAAADRGDQVVLLERTDRLGGQLNLAAAAPIRAELARLTEHMTLRVAASGIDLRLGRPADADGVASLRPDLVVLATGATQPASRFGTGAVCSWDILADPAARPALRPDVVLFDESGGNGWPLFATAEVLIAAGHRLTVVSGAAAIGTAVEAASLPPLLRRLRAEILLTSTVERSGDGLTIRNLYSGATTERDSATLVVESGRRPLDHLAQQLRGAGLPVVVVGDALAPRRISTAIREGRAAVRAE
ncbi:FAD-dependent oxidoreductase [Dactylosporangium salmoneum]|uniref:FAD-dependent oxidoreductase n=1 Tax=Dactylosporangium salmoneum TaxID=53361 RepID=A0ABN3GQM8_9ACTN